MNLHVSRLTESTARTTPFALPAHRHATVAALLDDWPDVLDELVDSLGSPLHVVLPRIFEENVAALRTVFDDHAVDGTILFAKKANKAECFVHAAARLGIGVDVASPEELTAVLASGMAGERIGVSGPEKDDTLLTLALRHRCLVAIDSTGELERTARLARSIGEPGRILLRCTVASQPCSRFGLTDRERREATAFCHANVDAVDLHGFSFHLAGYSTSERAAAASMMIDWCVEARQDGSPNCRHVDLGGGLAVQYVDPARWTAFLHQDSSRHYHAERTFGGFYPYGIERSGAQALHDILDHPVDQGGSLAAKVGRYDIRVIVEPGRVLLDQAGFTLFRVQGLKMHEGEPGYAILTVGGSSLSLSEQWFDSEFLPDPILLGAGGQEEEPFLACVAGSTCLENDMLTWRKIGFPRPVRRGDLLAYVNTAGYQMDSNESGFHGAAIPVKVVIDLAVSGNRPRWRLDTLARAGAVR